MVTNTGTYIDCPFHRFEDGKDLSEIALERFANLPCVTIDAVGHDEIGVNFFENIDLSGKTVMINTGWSKHWNTDAYFENHPYVTREAAEYLKENGAQLVGIDSHNIDNTQTKSRPVHTTLLGADILIVEHLCELDKLPKDRYLFSAVPPKVKGAGTFPVRAFATVTI